MTKPTNLKRIFRLIGILSAAVVLGFFVSHAPLTDRTGTPFAQGLTQTSADRSGADESSIPWAVPDQKFNALFTRYGNGWTGGDGTFSVWLPDGRTVWLFGDTFLGTVRPDRSRPKDSPLIRNSFVVQDKTSLVTLHGGTAPSPAALVIPADSSCWYWPADGTVEKDRLRVFLWKFRRTGAGSWDWAWTGTDIGTFLLPDLTLESIAPAVSGNRVMYGSCILEDETYTYIYGVEDLKKSKYGHLARTARNRLLGPWEFFTGKGWSADPSVSARILENVSNQYSVIAAGSRYVWITMDTAPAFGKKILGYCGPAPWGPWDQAILLYTTPEAQGPIVTYNAVAHPQFRENGSVLVSYNVNNLKEFDDLFRNADHYRPRFIRVDMHEIFGTGKKRLPLAK